MLIAKALRETFILLFLACLKKARFKKKSIIYFLIFIIAGQVSQSSIYKSAILALE